MFPEENYAHVILTANSQGRSDLRTMSDIPIDWASVNWIYVAVLSVFVFFSTLIGTLLAFKRAFWGAVVSTLLFAAAFVFWTYYPHGLSLPTSVTGEKAPANPQ